MDLSYRQGVVNPTGNRTVGRVFVVLLVTALPSLSQSSAAGIQQQAFEQGERALAEGRYTDAEAAYEKLRQLTPRIAEVHGRLGLIYFQEKKFEQAVPALRQALKLKPALPNTDVLLAMSLSELGQYKDALPGLEKAFRSLSDPALKRMGGLQLLRAYTGLQRDSKAVEVALDLTRAYPEDPEVLYHAGRLFGNFAYLTMKKLADIAPESVWRHQAAGDAYVSQGDYNLAILEYRKVLGLDPNRMGLHFRLGRSILLRSRQPNSQTEDADEAVKDFEQELALDPSNSNAAYELAEIHRKAGAFEKARNFFEQAVKYDPDFEDAQIGLGRTLTALNKPDIALPHLRKAIALDPTNEVTYYHLSQVYRELGNSTEQQKALAEFQRLRSQKQDRHTTTLFSPRDVTKQQLDPKTVP